MKKPQFSVAQATSEFDVLVVGSGIIGLAVAEACACRGLQVALCDAGQELPPASAARSGALVPAVGRRKDRPLGIMQRESLALYSEWCTRLASISGITIPLRELPVVRYIDGPEPISPVSQLQTLLQETFISAGASSSFANLGYGMEVDTVLLRESLRKAFMMQGGVFFAERVVTAAQSGQRVTSILDSETICVSRLFVACTGRYLSLLFPDSLFSDEATSDCVTSDWGQMVKVHPQSKLPAIVLVDGFTLVPKYDGSVWVTGAHRENIQELTPDVEVTQQMLHAAEKIFRERLELKDVWVGIRPRRRGGIPLIAPMTKSPGIIAAVGHSSNGFLLAPLTARKVLHLLAERL